jgi:hypothetical protein
VGEITEGLCQCGCGKPTRPTLQAHTKAGYERGQPQRFLRGHYGRTRIPKADLGRSGLCECGCGEATPLATKTKAGRQIKGQPLRFLPHHHTKLERRRKRRLDHRDYSIEDRGYETPCWICLIGQRADGYARVHIDGRYVYAHRSMYEQAIGPIPAGLELDHLCSVRACIRPDHLEPVTPSQNARRSSRWKK